MNDSESSVIRELAERVVLAARSNTDDAQQLLCRMELLSAQRPSDVSEAFCIRARGNLFQVRGDLTAAVERYRQAQQLFERAQDSLEAARTAASLVGALAVLGEFQEAFHCADGARAVFQALGEDLRLARLEVNVGNLYQRLGRMADALGCYERAIGKLEQSPDVEAAAVVAINRSVALMLLYRFDEAMECFHRARRFCESNGLRLMASQAEYNRAYLLYLLGDCTAALKTMQQAEAEFMTQGDDFFVAQCRLDRAEILSDLNLLDQAERLSRDAEATFRSMNVSGDRARALLLLGRCSLKSGNRDQAILNFTEARRLFEAEENRIWGQLADMERASALTPAESATQSLAVAAQASRMFQEDGHPAFAAMADLFAARVSLDQGEEEAAARFLDRCAGVLENPPVWLRYRMELVRARIHEACGGRSEALAAYVRAAELIEFLRNNLRVDMITVNFLEDKTDLYDHLAALAENDREALGYVELGRARGLSDAIRRIDQSKPGAAATPAVQRLREELRTDYILLLRKPASSSQALLERLTQKEGRLIQELTAANIDRSSDEDTPMLEKLPLPRLKSDEVLLEFQLADEGCAVFVVTGDTVQRVQLKISQEELRSEVDFIRYQITKPEGQSHRAALDHHLSRLYERLIEPVEPLLRRSVVIVPHRWLHALPFHALRAPWGYLLDRYTFSYAPSAAVYALTSARRAEPVNSCLIVGSNDAALPEAVREIEAVSMHLPNAEVVFADDMPSVREKLKSAAIVHIASHAVFRADSPAGPLLMLGSDAVMGTDLSNLDLKAQLVTMSACSTARTWIGAANETTGLVRAFLTLSVPSMVGSLWDVQDRSTAGLMDSFYAQLRSSADIAGSLRNAALRTRDRFEHPFYWAPFILIGKTNLEGLENFCTESRVDTDC
ncbi:MAG TPA: CHAT domain-containing tetratricopeptide repeat protein [Terriglobia bacterium]|nr:CHAT domain-containing tetratricopeptide repeat protein [Terriglobia bacterium]